MENWYVIQVSGGNEDKIIQSCDLLVNDGIILDSFIPKYTRLKKINGKWVEIEEVLFKGYVFIISDDVRTLYHELKKIPKLTKLLGKYEDEIYPLSLEEIDFLKTYARDKYCIDMSTGYIEGDQIIVTNGPLKGNEGSIIKIDRHKRLAYLDVNFFGHTTMVKVGLEVISKKINSIKHI